jgi:protein-tyrosine phosphatase
MLDIGRPAYRTLFETIATSSGGVLFHCAAGKDRTGIASALLLSLAGVPDDVIVQDYSLSEALLLPLLSDWLPRIKERGLTEQQARGMLASRPEAMETTLVHLHDRWGGTESYMRAIGMAPSLIGELRARIAS